ncbi:SGNH/GDSL hydrolase family protein [Spirosoma sp. BT702]|uniref:SGNH/GDSL hydrolase family protein n=1 Tax=Spirosoma profusum TaxID=2771354 RepID=A0A927ATP3_9BACT|nr:SGNH/GDSL hydrolase family protein [Spirosoma profusum]MBD2700737.1 SGNH/GDSL hydrolase family protein [Spirosoma profusum]
MKKLLLVTFAVIGLLPYATFAQATTEYTWWNPIQSSFPVIEGQGWPASALQNPYDRLPAKVEKSVRTPVWNLSHNAAGLLIRFRASTDQVVVRYVVTGKKELPHMPATGVSGVDLYAVNSDGDALWCAGKYTFGDTIQYKFTGLEPNDTYHQKGREYRLYLPLYNSVKWLEIGVPTSVTLTPLPVRIEKPIVVYGTSIAQGACASRPGMAWPAILGRKLDRPVINLAFSGNGRLEKEIIDILPDIDANIYVLDCLPNLVAAAGTKPDELKEKITTSVKTLRQRKPDTPILLVEHAGYSDGGTNTIRRQQYNDANVVMEQAFAQLKGEGIKNLYILPYSAINMDTDATVDGTHPTDLGMQEYADAYERSIRKILNEPIGDVVTLKPRTQYRDARVYDWETRHREIMARVQSKPPRILFIGNSITHFWGGESTGATLRGADSWDAVMKPLDVLNLGYGWDRIENVLWRVYHGELDGYQAIQIALMIGTNNLQLNSDAEISNGLSFLVRAIQTRQPNADILLIGILPRRNEEARIAQLNQRIAQAAGELNVTFIQPGTVFLKSDGKIDESMFSDGLHPNAEGYRQLLTKLQPYLKPVEADSKRKK